jgi:hypothetical protein
MNKITIVMKNLDMTEGRGPMIFEAAFSTFDIALEYANSKYGVMGRKTPYQKIGLTKYGENKIIQAGFCNDRDIYEIAIPKTLIEFNNDRKEAIRESIRIKVMNSLTPEDIDCLTPEERKILGV